MKDLMIDIETMGTGPNAVMIQLAGVYFDRKTGQLGAEFCQSLSIEDSLTLGFEKDLSTENWWKEQDQSVLENILSTALPVWKVLMAFNIFRADANFVWSHATFDFVIVQNHLKKVGLAQIPHKTARDIRTLVDLSGINLKAYDWTKKTHNALDDCKFQVQYCVDAMRRLKNEG